MATTIVNLSRSVGGAVNYATSNQRKPHHDISKNPKLNNRVIDRMGVNCSSNPHDAIIQMTHTLNKAGISKENISTIHTIISTQSDPNKPNYYNYRDPKDLVRFKKHVYRIIKAKYPNNQTIIGIQADNLHHTLHAHCITCARRFDTLASSTHNATWRKTLGYVDREFKKDKDYQAPTKMITRVNKYGKHYQIPKPSAIKYSAGMIHHIRKGDSWFQDFRNQINKNISKSTNLSSLINNLSKSGIQTELFHRHKVNGKRVVHIYKTPGKHPGMSLHYKNGYIHAKRQPSFKFIHNGKTYKIRGKSLGANYSTNSICNQLKRNQITIKRSIKSKGIAPKLSSKAKNNSHHIAKPNPTIHVYKTPKATFYSRKNHIYVKDQGQLFKIGHVDKSRTTKLYHPSGDKRFTKPYSKAPNHLVAMMYDCSKTKHFNLPTFTHCNRHFKPVSKPFLPHAPHLMILNASLNQSTIQLKNDKSMEQYMENMGKYDAQLAQYQANKDTNADIRNENLAEDRARHRNNYSRQ